MADDIVNFDFVMDTFVTVLAPRGTDPAVLYEQACEKFMDCLIEKRAIVRCNLEF
jgi:hypothetical protein